MSPEEPAVKGGGAGETWHRWQGFAAADAAGERASAPRRAPLQDPKLQYGCVDWFMYASSPAVTENCGTKPQDKLAAPE